MCSSLRDSGVSETKPTRQIFFLASNISTLLKEGIKLSHLNLIQGNHLNILRKININLTSEAIKENLTCKHKATSSSLKVVSLSLCSGESKFQCKVQSQLTTGLEPNGRLYGGEC